MSARPGMGRARRARAIAIARAFAHVLACASVLASTCGSFALAAEGPASAPNVPSAWGSAPWTSPGPPRASASADSASTLSGLAPWQADSLAAAKRRRARAVEPVLVRARSAFAYGHFERVDSLLAPGVAGDSLGARERPAALELLGRASVRRGDVEQGAAWFAQLLDTAPTWRMDARRVSGDELAVFERARLAWREAHPLWREPAAAWVPFYRQRRWQLAGGVAAASVFAIVRHQASGDSNKPLPELPGHP